MQEVTRAGHMALAARGRLWEAVRDCDFAALRGMQPAAL